MKKTLIIAAAALIGASAFAATNVTSANIVGYSKKDIAADQFLILAPQFGESGVALSNAFSGVSANDVVYTWDGSIYSQYTYYGPSYGWLDSAFSPAGGTVIDLGQGVWLKSTATTNVIMSGDVPTAGSITNTLVAGTLNMIANPYPVELALDDIPTNSISSTDIAYLWDGSIYAQYTYYGASYGWLDSAFGAAGAVTVPVGDGFWLQSAAGGEIIFDKQY